MAVELQPGGARALGLGRGAQAKTLTANWPEEALISDPFRETEWGHPYTSTPSWHSRLSESQLVGWGTVPLTVS